MGGAGYRAWTSGAEDPATFTGGTTNAADSWAAYTLALRPATIVVTVAPQNSTAIDDYCDMVATVTYDGSAVQGYLVTASSGSTGVATCAAITQTNPGAHSTWTLNGYTYSDPSVTTPDGNAAYRFTETAITDYHTINVVGEPTAVSGRTYTFVVEWNYRNTDTTGEDGFAQTSGGAFGSNANVQWAGATGVVQYNTSGLTTGTLALGNGWFRSWYHRTATSSAEITQYFLPDGSYLGDTGRYLDIGRVWIEEQYAVTDANGQATIRVRGVANGESTITVTQAGTTGTAKVFVPRRRNLSLLGAS
jgi:hypothetical protein